VNYPVLHLRSPREDRHFGDHTVVDWPIDRAPRLPEC
jgi:hypothetical protein